ncbi:staygreen family protein [Heyndrickxia vini]|uniref:Staygreen protein domain-containing protein n=1 Tax=Heyndrickxia vini TaxID=1476025 RepID=A0ABX7E660_9BACI|nr:staygreen family protein [Heyndrickxia vini]QQZ11244.1 hypothetical protein I5776_10305 [Heyndrickxia vini]
MDQLDKLSKNIIPPATDLNPLQGRKYTLTHSEATGGWLLSIGTQFPFMKLSSDHFDVIQAEWTTKMGEYILLGRININPESYNDKLDQVRYMIYQKELPHLIAQIIEADKRFILYHPLLLDAPIHVEIKTKYPEIYQTLYMGTARKYLKKESVSI